MVGRSSFLYLLTSLLGCFAIRSGCRYHAPVP
jgi:hypothetical protein